MNWFDLNKELRTLRTEAHQDFTDMAARSLPTVTPIVQAIYKIGQMEAQMLGIDGSRDKAQAVLDFIEKIKLLTVGNGIAN